MPQWAYILIAVAIIVALIVIFFVTFVAYRRTPTPKGCEHIKVDGETCRGCQNLTCEFHQKAEDCVERKEK